jgi:hypothetical protein
MQISIYDLEGNLLETIYKTTAKDLSERFEIDYTGVINHLNGGLLSAGRRYQFKKVFKGGTPNKIGNVVDAVLYSGGKKIHKFYKDIYISSYNSISEASLFCNIDNTAISKCVLGDLKSINGFVFKNVL